MRRSNEVGQSQTLCSGSEAGSYSRLIDFVYHSTLGLRVIKKKKKDADGDQGFGMRGWGCAEGLSGTG